MLQNRNVFFIKNSCELRFLPQSKRFSSILFGGKNPTTTNPKIFLHNYHGATFPSPYFGFFLAVALQFSVINTDKKFWQWGIRGCNLYSKPKETCISPKQFSLLLPKIISGNRTSVSECKPEFSMEQTGTETGFSANTQEQCKCQDRLIAWAECFGELQEQAWKMVRITFQNPFPMQLKLCWFNGTLEMRLQENSKCEDVKFAPTDLSIFAHACFEDAKPFICLSACHFKQPNPFNWNYSINAIWSR